MASPTNREDDPSQWTRITRKGKGKKLGRKEEVLRLPVGGPPENFHPNGSPQLTVDDIKANHDRFASKWRATKCYEQLFCIIKDKSASHEKITRAVCLGLGAFDPEDSSFTAQRRSHIQLAAFLAMVETLSRLTSQILLHARNIANMPWQSQKAGKRSRQSTKSRALPSQTRTF